jgi:hypothetical protein
MGDNQRGYKYYPDTGFRHKFCIGVHLNVIWTNRIINMADRIEINITTGERTAIPIDDTWILANRSSYLELAWDGGTNTLSAQLKTPLLTDDSRDNVSAVETWIITVGDIEPREISTDSNGQWSQVIPFVDNEQYTVFAERHGTPSNIVIIQDGV